MVKKRSKTQCEKGNEQRKETRSEKRNEIQVTFFINGLQMVNHFTGISFPFSFPFSLRISCLVLGC